MPRLHNGQYVDHKCKHLTLDINMLNNIFIFYVLKRKTIFFNV